MSKVQVGSSLDKFYDMRSVKGYFNRDKLIESFPPETIYKAENIQGVIITGEQYMNLTFHSTGPLPSLPVLGTNNLYPGSIATLGRSLLVQDLH